MGKQIIKGNRNKQTANVVSSPGETTIRSCGKYHSGPYNQTRTGTVYSSRTFQPNNSNPTQVNQTRFPTELVRPHREAHKESS